MKKEYVKPLLLDEEISIEDVIASSGSIGGLRPGDQTVDWPWDSKDIPFIG